MSKSGTSTRNGPHLKNSKLRKPSMAGVVCTENLNPDIVVMKPAEDRA
jgi:hypothetical protein